MFPKSFWKHYKFPINMIVNMNIDDNTKNIEKLIFSSTESISFYFSIFCYLLNTHFRERCIPTRMGILLVLHHHNRISSMSLSIWSKKKKWQKLIDKESGREIECFESKEKKRRREKNEKRKKEKDRIEEYKSPSDDDNSIYLVSTNVFGKIKVKQG